MSRFLGIDASSKSVAFGVVEGEKLLWYGEYYFTGNTFDRRLAEARKLTEALAPILYQEVDYICFEKAVMVTNKEVALKLAQTFGAIKSVLVDQPPRLVEAPPIVWQEKIGNPILKGNARKDFILKHPEWRTASQRSSGVRQYRKDVTRKIVHKKYGEDIANDNITDAIALAMFCQMEIKR